MVYNLLLQEFEKKLQIFVQSEKDIIKQSGLILGLCQNYMKIFKQHFVQEPFKDSTEEIYFFKRVKPYIVSEYVFYVEVRKLELALPGLNQKNRKNRIRKRLRQIEEFMADNMEFCQYIQSGYEYFDQIYFTRQTQAFIPKDNPFYYLDPSYNSSHSGLLAIFIAYTRLNDYLTTRMGSLDLTVAPPSFSRLEWTASKAALIELIYALHSSKVIGYGKTDIKTITQAFENIFNVKLSDPYKVFSEIKYRQKSKTKFLDELTHNLQQEMDDSVK